LPVASGPVTSDALYMRRLPLPRDGRTHSLAWGHASNGRAPMGPPSCPGSRGGGGGGGGVKEEGGGGGCLGVKKERLWEKTKSEG